MVRSGRKKKDAPSKMLYCTECQDYFNFEEARKEWRAHKKPEEHWVFCGRCDKGYEF